MNLAIIGYRGTGKTEVAKILELKLKKKVISTDDTFTTKLNQSIMEYVIDYGWEKFRMEEAKIVQGLIHHKNSIFDCGGGVVETHRNIVELQKISKIILLTADIDTIVRRIKKSTNRPSLTQDKSFTVEVEEVLKSREEKYNNAANFSVDTSNLTPIQVSNMIIRWYNDQ